MNFDKNVFRPLNKEQANELVNDEKFIRYRKSLEAWRDDISRKLNSPMNDDPIKDAHYLRACINTMAVLNQVLELPQEDIKKGKT
jgi:hypothetical protein